MYFADLHVHSSFKPFNNYKGGKNRRNSLTFSDGPDDIWEHILEDRLTMVPYTQGSLTQAFYGKANVLFLSILPMEIGWTQVENPLLNFFFQNKTIASLASSISSERMGFVKSSNYSYNEALQQEYDFILNELDANRNHEILKKVKIVNSISEAKAKADAGNISIILCIEGAHSVLNKKATQGISNLIREAKPLINDLNAMEQLIKVHLENEQAELCRDLMESVDAFINQIKSWQYKPYYLTLAHHFFNGFSGHALSFPKMTGNMLNQTLGMNYGLTLPGKYLVRELCKLEKENKIFIDAKHLSIKARQEVYAILKEEQKPPMVSHSAVNGWSTYEKSYIVNGKPEDRISGGEKYERNDNDSKFNNWSINLSEEEIAYLLKENSLIGIILDQRVLSNKVIALDISKNPRKHPERETIGGIAQVYRQIRHVCEVGLAHNFTLKESFAILCIGSDFDGLINPINDVKELKFFHPYAEEKELFPFKKPYHDNESFYPGLFLGLKALFEKSLNEENFWQGLNKTPAIMAMDIMCNNLINRLTTWK